jgi:cephalosporin-C deacetylase-like acetyl esterase
VTLPLFLLLAAIPPYAELIKLYDYDRAAPLEVVENGVEQRGPLAVHDISYASPMGGRVPAYLVVPPGRGPFAGILFQHGGGGSRASLLPGALRMAATGAVCLLIDAPLHGARSQPDARMQDFSKPLVVRKAMIQTVVDLRRAVDVLASRPEVDAKRLAYIGASYGGVIGGVLAGVERRIKAYALLVGMASLRDFVRDSTHPTAAAARSSIAPEQLEKNMELLEPVQPIHYIGHAAPSAVLLQSGRLDKLSPESSARRYQEAASEPKVVRWYDAGHSLNEEAFRFRAQWLREQIGIAPLQ